MLELKIKGKTVVTVDKPFITISGTKASETIITWNDSGDILQSPTFSVQASDFIGRFLTIQDTLFDDNGRHYYSNCYIEGAVDFNCGNAPMPILFLRLFVGVLQKCHLRSLSEGTRAITAQQRQSPSKNTGFIFLGCNITGVESTVLGRPWGAYSKVVFVQTYMSNVVLPQGWENWGDPAKQR
ncbi:hypothetical protein SLEP1_g48082 [Rubroshorea leprosula]|uniref:pectinesterase n=1 Tax=Rubroshorea leprosula TaxID=152421 RepID=A0AAV5LTK5_9ROSI|nr:hypothetical protein SLEP1_g48082 [Rubroshorea leprosula]